MPSLNSDAFRFCLFLTLPDFQFLTLSSFGLFWHFLVLTLSVFDKHFPFPQWDWEFLWWGSILLGIMINWHDRIGCIDLNTTNEIDGKTNFWQLRLSRLAGDSVSCCFHGRVASFFLNLQVHASKSSRLGQGFDRLGNWEKAKEDMDRREPLEKEIKT